MLQQAEQNLKGLVTQLDRTIRPDQSFVGGVDDEHSETEAGVRLLKFRRRLYHGHRLGLAATADSTRITYRAIYSETLLQSPPEKSRGECSGSEIPTAASPKRSGSPGRIRTIGHPINSRMLYR